jgi:hypothetical protein
MASNTLSTLYVDVVQRGLKQTMADLKALQRQADDTAASLRQMGGGGGAGGGRGKARGGDGLAGQLAGAAGGLIASVAAPAALGAAAVMATKAADPGVFEQLGGVMRDLAGTVGQLLAPAFRAFVPVLRTFADAVAGVADAFRPVVSAITSAVMPVVAAVGRAWGDHAKVMAGVVLPVLGRLAELLAPLGRVFVSLVAAFAPLAQAVARLQFTLLGLYAGVAQALLPVLRVFAAVLGGVATAAGEVVSLLADAFGDILTALAPLLAPVKEFITLLANGLVAAVRVAVSAFRAFIDTVRAVFGLSRRGTAAVGSATSFGRGMMNDTGTEDANSTYQRLQQAILKIGVPAEKPVEEEQLDELREIKDAINALTVAVNAAKQMVPQNVGDLVEGAGKVGLLGTPGLIYGWGRELLKR